MVLFMGTLAFQAQAFDVNENHTGIYVYGMGGMQTATDDTNDRTGTKFGNSVEPGFGLTVGGNITDWIASEMQFSYVTATGNTPSGQGREHLLTVRLNAKYSFLTNASMNKDAGWKIYPYAKMGGLAHGLYVNAPVVDDKVGAWGAGFGIGGGLEADYKALYLGLDLSNDFVFLQGQNRTIGGVDTEILSGGFAYQFAAMAAVGVHF